jgi:hypothetical protein
VYVVEVAVIDELETCTGVLDLEIERSPRNQRRLVSKPRKLEERFGMKARHGSPFFK